MQTGHLVARKATDVAVKRRNNKRGNHQKEKEKFQESKIYNTLL